MRVITVVDGDGNVVALMSMRPDGLRPSLPGLPPGQREVDIDVPDITDGMENGERQRRLHELSTQYRVDIAQATFVSR